MTIATDTPATPTEANDRALRGVRSRRHHAILSRHVPSCRVRGFGL